MNKMTCPICGQTIVEEYDICEICGWENDPVQSYDPDIRGANQMTLKEAREAWAKGEKVL